MSKKTVDVPKNVKEFGTPTITLNDQEKQILGGLLDLAVKAGGINVSGNALYFANKFGLMNQVDKKDKS